ncbi:arrestin-N domain-containing protein [Favolaschia claudopus]|uniref:Arrestin-N domain-containing protein n=1 Tax=Favolaschia claudopus TaxID=2862362 RepID=A0AAW0CKE0_9AGAR
MALKSGSQLIALRFPNFVRVAGEVIEGCVDLNVPLARKDGIDHLSIELEGVIKTKTITSLGPVIVHHKETVHLFDSPSQTLWSSKATQPDVSCDILSCPFRFTLPSSLPPSFTCGNSTPPDATVRYSLQAVGARSGTLQRNRRFKRVFLVMPAASERQMLEAEGLRQGWVGNGGWKHCQQDEKIRQGIWGEYSGVHASLSLPDLPSLPSSTPIPYTLHIMTDTKTLDKSDRPEDKHGKPLFPAPPTQLSELSVVLHRRAKYIVRDSGVDHEAERKDSFDLRSGRQLTTGYSSEEDVPRRIHRPSTNLLVDDAKWISDADSEERGVWRRSVRFMSTFVFPFAPSYRTETLKWVYTLEITIPFPGMGNDLTLKVPITLNPLAACPPPPLGAPGTSILAYADILPVGPPPDDLLDLPPAYFTTEGHEWDDEKAGAEKN